MILRIGKKLIWTLLIICLILAVILVILQLWVGKNFKFNFNWSDKEVIKPSIGEWIVMPEKDYSNLTLVVMQDSKTLARQIYQSIKLEKGYEIITPQDGLVNTNLANRLLIFNLPYSDRNELSNEAMKKYQIAKPFKEIYYCGDLKEALTKELANKLIEENKLGTTCQQINGFLF